MELFTPGHLIVLAIVAAVLFFGWKQLPDMARSLGRSLRVFKTEIKGMGEDDKTREAGKTETKVEVAPAAIEARTMTRIEAEPRRSVTANRPRPAPRPQTTPDRPGPGE